jgi:hypothetical protein
MTTIGLGKQAGAEEAHAHGLAESVQEVPKIALAKGNVILGLNVIENGYRQPYHVEVVEPADFWEADRRGLDMVRPFVARVPFERLDVLVVHYIGKNISGGGMDPNVIGFFRAEGKGEWLPDFTRIVALDLTDETQGNALGLGQADFVTRRLVNKIDYHATYMNMLTAAGKGTRLVEAAVPITLESDREAIEVALRSAVPEGRPRICWIEHTDALSDLWISEALLPEAHQNPQLEVLGEPGAWPFDHDGNLSWSVAVGRSEAVPADSGDKQ